MAILSSNSRILWTQAKKKMISLIEWVRDAQEELFFANYLLPCLLSTLSSITTRIPSLRKEWLCQKLLSRQLSPFPGSCVALASVSWRIVRWCSFFQIFLNFFYITYFDPILPPLPLPDHPRFLISQLQALSLKNKKAKSKQKPRNRQTKRKTRKQ